MADYRALCDVHISDYEITIKAGEDIKLLSVWSNSYSEVVVREYITEKRYVRPSADIEYNGGVISNVSLEVIRTAFERLFTVRSF